MPHFFRPCVSLVVVLACTKSNPAAFCPDGRCLDPKNFCDVHGAIAGEPGRCIAVDCMPGDLAACDGDTELRCSDDGQTFDAQSCGAGCEPNSGCRPFCTPNASSCTNSQLTSCNAQGTASTTETCALGCANDGMRCLTFEPSNGLGAALADSVAQPDIALPAGTRIDTDSGVVQDGNGSAVAVKSVLVPQAGAPEIRVLEAHSFSVDGAVITGSRAIAFVARGPITLSGRLTARASTANGGPGAQSSATCNGKDANQFSCSCAPVLCAVGTGGAGNAQAGGGGGGRSLPNANGGGALSAFSPLAGGCSGGSQRDPSGINVVARGGAGGGAVQLVSLDKVTLDAQGVVDVGGGGGASTTGGGSGGIVVIEAPQVSISGSGAGVAANGGAGGGCGMTGPDALANTSPAPGAVCANYFAGSGGTGAKPPGFGCVLNVDSCTAVCPVVYGGGGGSVGRMRVVTMPGGFQTSGSPVLSVNISTATLTPK
jgi:hypothetical protein